MNPEYGIARSGGDGQGSWLCESAAARERMLDMESRLRPVRTLAMAAIGIGLLLCGPWIGYWTLAPLVGAALCFVVADRIAGRIRRPEYAMMAAWLVTPAAIGAGIAVTGGPDSPALPLMAVPIVSLSARFSLRGVVAGVAATLVAIALGTFGTDPRAALDDPAMTILAAVAVVAVGALSTALMRSDLQHRSEAVIDGLTGMLNRKALESRALELEQQSRLVNQPVGLIVADIDRFKAINDEHGHAAGDAVLVDVAYLLRKELRAFDLAYRIGGEEFLMLLPGASVAEATRLAERLRQAVAAAPVAGGVRVTASFGVSASERGRPFEHARSFAAADAALLAAKREGRNRVRSAVSAEQQAAGWARWRQLVIGGPAARLSPASASSTAPRAGR